MYTYELYPVEDGFGYLISNDGSPCIQQDYAPDADGYVVMTEEQAIAWAIVIIARLSGE